MPGPTYGQNFSVRVPDEQARQFDAHARAVGLRRSELLRLIIVKTAQGGIPTSLLASGEDIWQARTIGAPQVVAAEASA